MLLLTTSGRPGKSFSVLRIRYVLSRIPDPNFSIPDQGLKRFSDLDPYPHPRIFCILTQKIVSKLSEYDPGCSSRIRIPDPDLDFLPIPDPGVKRHRIPDLGSGSATLVIWVLYVPTVWSNGIPGTDYRIAHTE
jgi:hypothetical protein